MNQGVLVTGALGLVGSYVAKACSEAGYDVYSIDNDIRSTLFPDITPLSQEDIDSHCNLLSITKCFNVDIRDYDQVRAIFFEVLEQTNIIGVIHCAAQPSHDWAATSPLTDFHINASGTLHLLELTRLYSPSAVFIQLSTNKVYGDLPNELPLRDIGTRFEIESSHSLYNGINETFSIDHSKHSLFGCSKLAADVYTQEYSRYFGLKTVVLRGGCLTGGLHRGAKLHGFLSYLVKSALAKDVYEIIGYEGKQVRDNLHAADIGTLVISIIDSSSKKEFHWHQDMVFNLGGGRQNSVSVIEAINMLQDSFDLAVKTELVASPRSGDHKWYISDVTRLQQTFDWNPSLDLHAIFEDLITNYA